MVGEVGVRDFKTASASAKRALEAEQDGFKTRQAKPLLELGVVKGVVALRCHRFCVLLSIPPTEATSTASHSEGFAAVEYRRCFMRVVSSMYFMRINDVSVV